MGLLKQCELVSNKVPGSKAMMNRARGDIRGYVGEFGIFQLFLTLNPSPIHSPAFQIFYGDQSTKLELRVPSVPKSNERGIRVADDPVAASDYFHFHIQAVFKYLFGWDSKTKESTEEGGIFRQLAAFFLVKEHTMRGQLHGHALIWLKRGINPSRLRRRMQNDTEFQKQYLAFFDSIIHHHIPPANVVDQAIPTDAEPTRFPRQECPPDPDAPDFPSVFEADHRLLGDDVQRHLCRTTCFKGGRTSCRFLFPHELNPTSHYDIETNSINLRIKDPVINWHNPALLVATRHNHDLKSVQSGRGGLAAASYITSYATKSEETPANQISMIQTVLERMASLGQDATELRGLLSRCVMQFGRERQVHAQQAATYVRDLGDTYQSHNTIAMLSGRMMLTVVKLYGAPRKDSGADSEPSDPPSISTELSTTTNAPAPVAMGETDETSLETIASTAAAEDEVDRVDENDDDDSDDDDELLPLSATGDAHQVDDYFHRGDSLQHLSFYDFVRFCKLIKVPKKANKNHHALGDSHPNIGKRLHRYTARDSTGNLLHHATLEWN